VDSCHVCAAPSHSCVDSVSMVYGGRGFESRVELGRVM
jgi:hypothetical protein